MSNEQLVLLVVALVVVAIVIALAVVSSLRMKRRHEMLREQFGDEYERARLEHGRRADRVLSERLEHVRKLRIHDLDPEERARFRQEWTTIQARFVDDPHGAVARANELIKDVMQARGYPPGDPFERRIEDLSVDHADVVQHYRAARSLAAEADTEDLRQAVVHYRAIVADLLAPAEPGITPGAGVASDREQGIHQRG